MPRRFAIGPWVLDTELNTVYRDGRVIRLEPKVVEVGACLAERAGEVVRKEELIRAVWPDTFVTDDVLTHAISELRKARPSYAGPAYQPFPARLRLALPLLQPRQRAVQH
jgi:DNA-binding winged helix-turn-helix (wHTH) protein